MLTASQIDAQRRVDATRAALDRLAADHQLLVDATGHIRRPRGLPTPERMAAAGEAWAAERADTLQQLAQGLAPLGASPAPAGVDLVRIDTLAAVAAGLERLERDVIAWVAPSLAPTDTVRRRCLNNMCRQGGSAGKVEKVYTIIRERGIKACRR